MKLNSRNVFHIFVLNLLKTFIKNVNTRTKENETIKLQDLFNHISHFIDSINVDSDLYTKEYHDKKVDELKMLFLEHKIIKNGSGLKENFEAELKNLFLSEYYTYVPKDVLFLLGKFMKYLLESLKNDKRTADALSNLIILSQVVRKNQEDYIKFIETMENFFVPYHSVLETDILRDNLDLEKSKMFDVNGVFNSSLLNLEEESEGELEEKEGEEVEESEEEVYSEDEVLELKPRKIVEKIEVHRAPSNFKSRLNNNISYSSDDEEEEEKVLDIKEVSEVDEENESEVEEIEEVEEEESEAEEEENNTNFFVIEENIEDEVAIIDDYDDGLVISEGEGEGECYDEELGEGENNDDLFSEGSDFDVNADPY